MSFPLNFSKKNIFIALLLKSVDVDQQQVFCSYFSFYSFNFEWNKNRECEIITIIIKNNIQLSTSAPTVIIKLYYRCIGHYFGRKIVAKFNMHVYRAINIMRFWITQLTASFHENKTQFFLYKYFIYKIFFQKYK